MARRKKATLEARHPKSRASRFMLIQAKVRLATDFFGPTKRAGLERFDGRDLPRSCRRPMRGQFGA